MEIIPRLTRTEIFCNLTTQDITLGLIINLIIFVVQLALAVIDFTIISRKITFYNYYIIKQSQKMDKKIKIPDDLLEYDYYFVKMKKSGYLQFGLLISQIILLSLEVIGFNCLYGFLTQVAIDVSQIVFLCIFKNYMIKINKDEDEKLRQLKKRYSKYLKNKEIENDEE